MRPLRETEIFEPLKAAAADLYLVPRPSRTRRAPEPESAPLLAAPCVAQSGGEAAALPRVLRVDQGKIDVIMNLVAELIVAKNGLNYLADLAENKHGSRAMAREIKDAYAVFDRITQGLQLGVMSVRMTPVSQMLQRFPRLVRDLSRALGKKVDSRSRAKTPKLTRTFSKDLPIRSFISFGTVSITGSKLPANASPRASPNKAWCASRRATRATSSSSK